MKIQEILKGLKSGTQAYLLRQLIISRTEDVIEIQKAITENEQLLAVEIEQIIRSDINFFKYKHIFEMKVSLDKSDVKISLLKAFCLQIAESLRSHYETPEEKENPFINYGGIFYNIQPVELREVLGIGYKKSFNHFNNNFEKDGLFVNIQNSNFNLDGDVPLLIHLRILL